MAETIELDNLEQPVEDTNEIGAEDEEETNLIDDNDDELNRSIPVPTGFNSDIGVVPNIRRDAGVMKRAFVYDKKNFLKEALKTNLNKGDGPNSTIPFDNLVITTDQRTGKNNGAKFKNVQIIIIIYQSSKFSYSCVSLVENLSREIDEIKLSPSHQRERETMHYSPVNNEKKSRAPSREHATFGQPAKTANVLNLK